MAFRVDVYPMGFYIELPLDYVKRNDIPTIGLLKERQVWHRTTKVSVSRIELT